MIDYNDDNYLQKLSKASNSPQGRIIIEYLREELKQFDYENIDTNKAFEEIGRKYEVYKSINQYLKDILSRLTNN